MPKTTEKQKVKAKPPKGWFMAGANPDMYEAAIDTTNPHSGTKCAHMYNAEPIKKSSSCAWGTLMQQMRPDNYLDKRVRMSLWVKTEEAQWVAPWMRIDGQEGDSMLGFDNFCDRQIKGTTGWSQHSIVLDVPANSSNIAFGIMLGGKGDLWLDDVSFDVVDNDVKTTDCPCGPGGKGLTSPQNLNFEEGEED